MNKESERQVGEEVTADGGKDALRRALRGRAERFVSNGTLQGYLAYADGVPVGWCNANNKSAFLRFDFNENLTEFICSNGEGKIKAVTCFTIAPGYRSQGLATALLQRVISDAKAERYDAVEGYPRFHENREPFDYNGPVRLYEKAGFIEVARHDGRVVMRKELEGNHESK
jgi:GNAT superfamily N-acetyltransferase